MEVHALHAMPVEGPEGDLHGHGYRIDVVIACGELDQHGMVVDLAALERELQNVRDELHGRDLEAIRPPDAEAVTVEVLARWAWERLAPMVRSAAADDLSVRVFESPTAFGGHRGPVS